MVPLWWGTPATLDTGVGFHYNHLDPPVEFLPVHVPPPGVPETPQSKKHRQAWISPNTWIIIYTIIAARQGQEGYQHRINMIGCKVRAIAQADCH